jgi:NAD(P)-dependent dehydrogenase (short-subunit alcohol dehydrogenase family)
MARQPPHFFNPGASRKALPGQAKAASVIQIHLRERPMAGAKVDPNGKLKGKIALVTGASRGIGEAICIRLAMAGARVIATARTAGEGESKLSGTLADTVERVKKAGGEATFIKADLSKAEERERLIAEAVELYGPIDILVNNAAITFFIPVADFTDKRMRLMMEIGVFAPFHLSQLVLASMKERKSGHIINISSGASAHPKAGGRSGYGQTVYGMCKAALERFTTGLAVEVHRHNIAVNVISPGLVATPGLLLQGTLTDADKERFQPIEIIAEAVFQLAIADPGTMTGRIDNAEPLLKELRLAPSELV